MRRELKEVAVRTEMRNELKNVRAGQGKLKKEQEVTKINKYDCYGKL